MGNSSLDRISVSFGTETISTTSIEANFTQNIDASVCSDTEQLVLSMKQANNEISVAVEDHNRVIDLRAGEFAGVIHVDGGGSGGTTNYNNLTNRPTINGVLVSGNKTSGDYYIILQDTTAGWNNNSSLITRNGTIYVYTDHELVNGHYKAGIKIGDGTSYLIDMPFINDATFNYSDLTNKPVLNNVIVQGNKTIADYGIVLQDTTSGWSSRGSMASSEGTIYVYLDGDGANKPLIKVGDGHTAISSLPFVGGSNSGSGGTSDYTDLTNKPTINNVTLIGNKTTADLGIVLSDTTANWNNQSSLITTENTIYVYRDFKTIDNGNGTYSIFPGIKIGDGTSYLIDMPFADGEDPRLIAHIANNTIHVTAAEKEFWNNKWRGYITELSPENLVFTTN